MAQHDLAQRLANKQATIGVVGLGYVGLPLLLAFAERGFAVVGIDTDAAKVAALARGDSYMQHIAPARIAQLCANACVTNTFAAAATCDAILIAVPTPLDANRQPDMAYVAGTARSMAPFLREGQLIVLESTTYPGTTRAFLRPLLEAGSGLIAGETFHLAFSPEREDPGNATFAFADIPKVIGGLTPACRDAAQAVYGCVVEQVVLLSSLEAAELTKLLENVFRSVNIALVNELKMLTQAMGIDIWEVIDAAATKPFGFMPFYPGPGLGGHCIPIDPFYLSWRAKEFDQATRFIELAGEINTRMPHYVVDRIAWALNDHGKAVRHSRLLILGVAYKKDVDDLREAPALRIIALLHARGANVAYHDPFVPRLPKTRSHHFDLTSVPLDAATLAAHDAAIIVTDHTPIDYAHVVAHAPLTVDTRNATRDVGTHRSRIIYA